MFRPAVFVSVLLLTMVSTTVFAAVYEPKPLTYGTRDQYRACLESDDRIKAHGKQIAEFIAENNATMVQIQIEAATLVELQAAIATNNRQQVENFNRRIEEHNQLVKAANEHAERTKAELEAYNREMAEHNKRCSSLVYKMEDREAVQKERKAAGK